MRGFTFHKYQGTGNDFIIIDNRDMRFSKNDYSLVAKLCDRHFGIGADGLMLLQNKTGFDFEMVYFNSDGNPSSMCGNGGRCIVAFARKLNLIDEKALFWAIDGEHEASIKNDYVSLKMCDVNKIEKHEDYYFLNTGSPHYVKFVSDLAHYNVFEEGRKVRYNNRFKQDGTNVNFIETENDKLFVRTYERGVEGETFSCGTGVVASALVAAVNNISTKAESCLIKTLGGNLNVCFNRKPDNTFDSIYLEGPANFVFKGEMEV